MKYYAGIDLHSSDNYLGIIDETDKRVFDKRINNDLPDVLSVCWNRSKAIWMALWWKLPTTGTGWWMAFNSMATRSIWPTHPLSNSMKDSNIPMTGGNPSGWRI